MTRRTILVAISLGFALGVGSSTPLLAQQKATTVQLPSFGISIDAAGVLKMMAFPDPGGRLMRQRALAALANLPQDLAGPSPLRKISLRRLEAAVAERLKEGEPLDESMLYLAGLQRVKYVFFYPDEKEIVIAGPAEGWVANLAGRVIGVRSGLPALELVDLVVALRAFPPGKRPPAMVGCSIDPNPKSLVALRAFQQKIPRTVRQNQRASVARKVAQGVQQALGMADIRVFGVPSDTHFAQVLIEADYRMKLIGVGLERTPIKLPSYLDLLKSVRQGTLQRWWFTPDYECVKMTADHFAMELEGQGVQLQTEDKLILPGGGLANTRKASRASQLFTRGFTRMYPQLAARRPIFAQLRNLIDMSVAAAFIQQEDYYGKAGWRMETWSDERIFKVRGKPSPAMAPCVANSRWKKSRLFTPAGGGVDIHAERALNPELVRPDKDGKLKGMRETVSKLPPKRWWWD